MGGLLIIIGCVAKCIPRIGKINIACIGLLGIHGLLDPIANGLCIGGQHCGLVHDSYAPQMHLGVKPLGCSSRKMDFKLTYVLLAGDEFTQQLCLCHIFDDEGMALFAGMAEGGAGLFVLRFSVNNDGVILRGQFCRTLPNLFDERTRRIVGVNIHTNFLQFGLDFEGCPKGWDQNHIVMLQLGHRCQHISLSVL